MQMFLVILVGALILWLVPLVSWLIWLNIKIQKELAKGYLHYDSRLVDALLEDFACVPAHWLPTHWLRSYRRFK
jgi:hypothetical protein